MHVEIKLKGEKPWLAKITGLDLTYGLARTFKSAVNRHAEIKTYLVRQGLYEYFDETGRGGLLVTKKGKCRRIAQENLPTVIRKILGRRAAAKKRRQREIDQKLKRFTAEGGFSEN